MRAQYSFRPSVMLFCHSKRRMGAESRAERSARYELKLLYFRSHFMILMNFTTRRSRSRASSCWRIFVLESLIFLVRFRWMDYLLNIWPFTLSKFAQYHDKFAKVGSKFCQMPPKNLHSLFTKRRKLNNSNIPLV